MQNRSGNPGTAGKVDPIRSCIGCGVRASRRELLRVVERDGHVTIDEKASLSGRGAWVHDTATCIERAIARGVFPRALRVKRKLDTTPLENRLENMMDK